MTRSMVLLAAAALMALPAPVASQAAPGAHLVEQWDADGDGAVSRDEVRTRRSDVFYMFDADGNGVLDAAEYSSFDDTRAADMAQARARPGNGPDGMGGSGQGKAGRQPDGPQDLLRRAGDGMSLPFNDRDGDGLVTEAEFTGRSDAFFDLLDRDGDGAVTAGDFGPR